MDAAEETKNVEELEEEVEEEEVEDEVEEEEGGGGGEGVEKVLDNVDSAGEEIKQLASGPSSAGKIFVGGVAWETTEETFTQHFMKYGDITDSVIMKEKHTQKPRGFGFVTFSDPSVVDKVLEDEHVIDGRMVEVKRTVPRGDMAAKGLGAKTRKIFVGGIPTSLTEDELEEHFSAYGKVVEHQIMLDHAGGRSRGFGFVTFESEDPVEKLISEGRMHDLNGKQVEIKKAEPKKSGGGPGINGRAGYTSRNAYGSFGGSTHGYVGGYQSGNMYYGGRAGGGYGRGYGYGGGPGYGAAYGAGYGAPVYETGGYGSANGYGNPRGYGGAYDGGRIFRYHPYGR